MSANEGESEKILLILQKQIEKSLFDSFPEAIDSIKVFMGTEGRTSYLDFKNNNIEFVTLVANYNVYLNQKHAKSLIYLQEEKLVELPPPLPASSLRQSALSKVPLYVLVGAIIGMIIGSILLYLFDLLDNTMDSPNDLRSRCKMPILGYCKLSEDDIVPKNKLSKQEV